MLILAMLFYISVLMVVIAFFAGAARVNEFWDRETTRSFDEIIRHRRKAA